MSACIKGFVFGFSFSVSSMLFVYHIQSIVAKQQAERAKWIADAEQAAKERTAEVERAAEVKRAAEVERAAEVKRAADEWAAKLVAEWVAYDAEVTEWVTTEERKVCDYPQPPPSVMEVPVPVNEVHKIALISHLRKTVNKSDINLNTAKKVISNVKNELNELKKSRVGARDEDAVIKQMRQLLDKVGLLYDDANALLMMAKAANVDYPSSAKNMKYITFDTICLLKENIKREEVEAKLTALAKWVTDSVDTVIKLAAVAAPELVVQPQLTGAKML